MSKKDVVFALTAVVVLVVIGIYFASGDNKDRATQDNDQSKQGASVINQAAEAAFAGEQGQVVNFDNGQIKLAEEDFSGSTANYYNARVLNKTVYFFVVRDKNGVYRAAANACQVCFGARMGFAQSGDYMICNTCGNEYPLEKIATEKGGCNPGPISPNLQVIDGQVIIEQADMEEVTDLF